MGGGNIIENNPNLDEELREQIANCLRAVSFFGQALSWKSCAPSTPDELNKDVDLVKSICGLERIEWTDRDEKLFRLINSDPSGASLMMTRLAFDEICKTIEALQDCGHYYVSDDLTRLLHALKAYLHGFKPSNLAETLPDSPPVLSALSYAVAITSGYRFDHSGKLEIPADADLAAIGRRWLTRLRRKAENFNTSSHDYSENEFEKTLIKLLLLALPQVPGRPK